jgi:hypothetical protein
VAELAVFGELIMGVSELIVYCFVSGFFLSLTLYFFGSVPFIVNMMTRFR